MITVYLRRFAGLISFDSKRCRSHFSASGPPGTFESRRMPALEKEMNQYGDHGEPARDDHGERGAPDGDPARVLGMVETDRLQRAGNPVAQVQADEERREHVERDPQRVLKHLDLGAI